ncbi:MAG: YraN family protein [Nitrospirae bacterium]|nr:YraN family protein [Nitrospirota bacterium]
MKTVKDDLGRKGEKLAAALCRERGLSVLELNHRTPFGEIDIIARDGDVLVFIEVKTRTGNVYGAPFEAVTRRKQQKIRSVALNYMKRLRTEVPVRFDVISVSMQGGKPFLEYIQDAFEV